MSKWKLVIKIYNLDFESETIGTQPSKEKDAAFERKKTKNTKPLMKNSNKKKQKTKLSFQRIKQMKLK